MSNPDCLLLLTTLPAEADATALAMTLVDERLAACVAVHPVMESVYRWDGRVVREAERQLVIKTSTARRDDLLTRLAALHPYEVPEVLVLRAEGSEAYLRWIEEETTAAPSTTPRSPAPGRAGSRSR